MTGSEVFAGRRPPVVGRGRFQLILVVLGVLAATLTGPVPAGAGSRYSDVVDGEPHHGAIEALASLGTFVDTECGEDLFCPDDPIERWTMAVWTIRVLEEEPSDAGESSFPDVDSDEWWASYVERLYEVGITVGCETERLEYCPDQAVTRGQMASFLVRAFSLPSAPSAGFGDTGGNVHEANIDALAAAGITVGCTTVPFHFCPDDPVSRAQMASFLFRASLSDVPNVDLVDLSNGETVNLRSLIDGSRPVMLWFWAPWCPQCRTDAGKMERFATENADRVTVVAILPWDCLQQHEAEELATGQDLTMQMLWDQYDWVWPYYGSPVNSSIWLLDRFGTRVGDHPTRFSIGNAEELLVDLAEPPLPGLD